MATWQQNINAGGLLAGIGQVNTNAPNVHDIDRATDYIRQNNNLERSGANNIGLTALMGANSVVDILNQHQQAERQKQFQQEYANTYASGDKTAMRNLAVKYPEQFKAVQSGLGFIDDDHRQTAGTLAAGARIASQSPEGMQQWLTQNAGELQRIGVDPSQVAGMYQQNPQGFGELMDHLGMAALNPKEYYDTQDKIAGRGIQAGQLSETARSNQTKEYLQQRGQDMSNNNASLDRDIRRAELQDKALDRQISRETNVEKLNELKLKQQQLKQNIADARQSKVDKANQAYTSINSALKTLDQLEQSPGLSKSVGYKSMLPTIGGTDAANFEAQLDTFKAQTFLPMVQSLRGMGALSDAEGKKLTDAVGALNLKMSQSAFKKSITSIREDLQNKLKVAERSYGVPIGNQSNNANSQVGSFTTKSGIGYTVE